MSAVEQLALYEPLVPVVPALPLRSRMPAAEPVLETVGRDVQAHAETKGVRIEVLVEGEHLDLTSGIVKLRTDIRQGGAGSGSAAAVGGAAANDSVSVARAMITTNSSGGSSSVSTASS